MKTIQIFFLFITLICTPCLCAHSSFANEAESAPASSSLENNTIDSNSFINQEQGKKVLPNTAKEKDSFSSEEAVPSFGWGNYFQGIGLMLLLLFAFWYILKLMRKYGNGRFLPNQKLLPRDSMYLEGQLPLGQGKSILIVKVLDERLVLGVTEKNINLLSKTGTNHAETFEELMQQVPFKNTPDA